MESEATPPFADNWAYLRTELNWLDRLLMLAISRQRQDQKEVDRVARSNLDRATSHWWKGIISVNRVAYDDSHPPTQPTVEKHSYQKQLEARIRVSKQQGIVLALPTLCDRLKLSLFEKNLILLALAPEVNLRYCHLYQQLQQEHLANTPGLPTVELGLRLLCRNDLEWRRSRSQLTAPRSLLARGVLLSVTGGESSLLSHGLKVAEPVVNYLLSERPDTVPQLDLIQPIALRMLPLGGTALESPAPLVDDIPEMGSLLQPAVPWTAVVLPKPILSRLTVVCQQAKLLLPDEAVDGEDAPDLYPVPSPARGTVGLLSGCAGTGKTLTAHAIATELHTPLYCLDLAMLSEAERSQPPLIPDAALTRVILIEAAQHWLGRHATVDPGLLRHWFDRQCQHQRLVLLTTDYLQTIRPTWRQHLDWTLELPLPNQQARITLWQLALQAAPALDRKLNGTTLAKYPLTGGDIDRIAKTAIAIAQAESAPKVKLSHVQAALHYYGKA